MGEPKFTPGPWKWIWFGTTLKLVSGEIVVLDTDSMTVYDHGLGFNREADRQLIEAAPELLKQLQKLIESSQKVIDLSDRDHDAWNETKAVIANGKVVIKKARGKG